MGLTLFNNADNVIGLVINVLSQ